MVASRFGFAILGMGNMGESRGTANYDAGEVNEQSRRSFVN